MVKPVHICSIIFLLDPRSILHSHVSFHTPTKVRPSRGLSIRPGKSHHVGPFERSSGGTQSRLIVGLGAAFTDSRWYIGSFGFFSRPSAQDLHV